LKLLEDELRRKDALRPKDKLRVKDEEVGVEVTVRGLGLNLLEALFRLLFLLLLDIVASLLLVAFDLGLGERRAAMERDMTLLVAFKTEVAVMFCAVYDLVV